MRPNHVAFSSLLILAGITAVFVLPSRAASARPDVPTPDLRAEQFDAWSPTLERGGTVRLVRRLCASQKAAHLARTGAPAPELVDAGEIRTFGPIPDTDALRLAASMELLADTTLERAERMTVEDLEQARAQVQEVLHGLKARAAAAALGEGRYWTVARNAHPRLPRGFSYWQTAMAHRLDDGTWVDVFVPIDLRSPELAATYDAVLSLEDELRRDRCDAFNRMPLDERRALCDDAWTSARGEHVDRDIPRWFWKLDVDRTTLIARPTGLRR